MKPSSEMPIGVDRAFQNSDYLNAGKLLGYFTLAHFRQPLRAFMRGAVLILISATALGVATHISPIIVLALVGTVALIYILDVCDYHTRSKGCKDGKVSNFILKREFFKNKVSYRGSYLQFLYIDRATGQYNWGRVDKIRKYADGIYEVTLDGQTFQGAKKDFSVCNGIFDAKGVLVSIENRYGGLLWPKQNGIQGGVV